MGKDGIGLDGIGEERKGIGLYLFSILSLNAQNRLYFETS
jgi:hypothetical protein